MLQTHFPLLPGTGGLLKARPCFLQALVVITLMVLTSVSCKKDNTPSDYKDLEGTWYADLSGETHSLWSYGKAWNVWTFQTDGTGVCDVFYTAEDQPMAIEHQPFTYTITGDILNIVMEDGPWDCTYKIAGNTVTLDDKAFGRADAQQVARFSEWSQKDLIQVPGATARYTVFVYGNAGGNMDYVIEDDFWEAVKPYLTDPVNVRVVCFYKYGKDLSEEGKPFTGKYADPGDIVWFELNSKTDLENLREEGLSSRGFAEQAKKMKLCDPASIRMFMEFSSLKCPAHNYIFSMWGHGNGYEPMFDVPGKYDGSVTRGLMSDEWNDDEKLDMYELSDAIRSTGVDRLKAIFFHNCLMGNIESLTELYNQADYIACSAHMLNSDYTVLPAFIKGLIEKNDVEEAFASMLADVTPDWQNAYRDNKDGVENGDFKLLRTAGLDDVLNACKRLADRLITLYPSQKEAIDRATRTVYRFYQPFDIPQLGYYYPLFDLADYAHLLAKETGDDEFTAISSAMDQAFSKAILQRVDINWTVDHLDHYSLSVCLYHCDSYIFDFVGAGMPYNSNLRESYEQSTFHKLTGWGNWLSINTGQPWGNPTNGGGGLAQ